MSFVWYVAVVRGRRGLLVTVHEFGHYWVARRLGFKVLRFSVGFGRPLLSTSAVPTAPNTCSPPSRSAAT